MGSVNVSWTTIILLIYGLASGLLGVFSIDFEHPKLMAMWWLGAIIITILNHQIHKLQNKIKIFEGR
ncbi:hypothetical protein [Ralstonia phage RSP15]|uniref:hypothetical protein n=1 Tax=Ralstonia phage RSP15 TaxID=1785960 RepID=UPI00074D4356|nr:hypothetical protein BH754_gp096 [Ralstonia phage RSP15]BAU40054.1 hypothetical protein [Ralstonia phage RSP15]